ncbi:hypothetical protein KP509_28G051000 [Ceratopteris richardii]|uniref:Uncharacterized protein n=1 Tax=Ceratopteris richardii TaxID=49495 RepID=A0A8T2RC45_CERRI|nr:hypothetical protein KP509_28G051000 [Ceratopteris richardii]
MPGSVFRHHLHFYGSRSLSCKSDRMYRNAMTALLAVALANLVIRPLVCGADFIPTPSPSFDLGFFQGPPSPAPAPSPSLSPSPSPVESPQHSLAPALEPREPKPPPLPVPLPVPITIPGLTPEMSPAPSPSISSSRSPIMSPSPSPFGVPLGRLPEVPPPPPDTIPLIGLPPSSPLLQPERSSGQTPNQENSLSPQGSNKSSTTSLRICASFTAAAAIVISIFLCSFLK